MGDKIITNMLWRFAERCGAQGVTFIVSIVLARILAPEVYGTIALITVFITILNVFVDSGFGNALIQKKDADDLDFSTVFYFNIVICCSLYVLMFFLAPYIAEWYQDSSLTPVIRVLSLTLVISGIKNVQQAYVSKQLQFKKFFFATLGGTLVAACIGIWMAYAGYGVWALVAQQLVNALIDTMILWMIVKWRPKWAFSLERLKQLFSFGWKLLVSALLDTAYDNIRQLLIGKIYSGKDLAFFNKGKEFPSMIVSGINCAFDSVIFPVLSLKQNDTTEVKRFTRKTIRMSSFIIWPIALGMAGCADTLVRLLLTEKWLPCVPFFQIFCFSYGFWPVHTANLNAMKALGRSDQFLKLEIIKKCIGIIAIVVSLPFGVMAMALSFLVISPISAFINATPNRKLFQYQYREQLKDMLPSMLLALVMAFIIQWIPALGMNLIGTLVVQVILGIFIYGAGAVLFRFEVCRYIFDRIKKKEQK